MTTFLALLPANFYDTVPYREPVLYSRTDYLYRERRRRQESGAAGAWFIRFFLLFFEGALRVAGRVVPVQIICLFVNGPPVRTQI